MRRILEAFRKKRGTFVWLHFKVPARAFFTPMGTKNEHIPEELPVVVHREHMAQTLGFYIEPGKQHMLGLPFRIVLAPFTVGAAYSKPGSMRIYLECQATGRVLNMAKQYLDVSGRCTGSTDHEIAELHWYYKEVPDTREHHPMYRTYGGYTLCLTFEDSSRRG